MNLAANSSEEQQHLNAGVALQQPLKYVRWKIIDKWTNVTNVDRDTPLKNFFVFTPNCQPGEMMRC